MGKYDDIINLPHYQSPTRPHMSDRDRAAQFSPFAALTGFEAQIAETGRYTAKRRELDEYTAARLDACLQILIDRAAERPPVSVTYFMPDEKKSGGAYVQIHDCFRRFDESDRSLVFVSGLKIPVDDVYAFEGEVFHILDDMGAFDDSE